MEFKAHRQRNFRAIVDLSGIIVHRDGKNLLKCGDKNGQPGSFFLGSGRAKPGLQESKSANRSREDIFGRRNLIMVGSVPLVEWRAEKAMAGRNLGNITSVMMLNLLALGQFLSLLSSLDRQVFAWFGQMGINRGSCR